MAITQTTSPKPVGCLVRLRNSVCSGGRDGGVARKCRNFSRHTKQQTEWNALSVSIGNREPAATNINWASKILSPAFVVQSSLCSRSLLSTISSHSANQSANQSVSHSGVNLANIVNKKLRFCEPLSERISYFITSARSCSIRTQEQDFNREQESKSHFEEKLIELATTTHRQRALKEREKPSLKGEKYLLEAATSSFHRKNKFQQMLPRQESFWRLKDLDAGSRSRSGTARLLVVVNYRPFIRC